MTVAQPPPAPTPSSAGTRLPPAAAVAPPAWELRRFTVSEYHRMAEIGVLGEDDHVELLEGWIVYKMTRNPPHDVAVALASKTLMRLLPGGWHVRPQSALTTRDSQPEPDVAVVRGEEREYLERHPAPADVATVIEVADTSLARDRLDKGRVYARAGVAVYWIINLIEGRIEAYTNPAESDAIPSFRTRVNFTRGQTVPLTIGEQTLAVRVDDLLP